MCTFTILYRDYGLRWGGSIPAPARGTSPERRACFTSMARPLVTAPPIPRKLAVKFVPQIARLAIMIRNWKSLISATICAVAFGRALAQAPQFATLDIEWENAVGY